MISDDEKILKMMGEDEKKTEEKGPTIYLYRAKVPNLLGDPL